MPTFDIAILVIVTSLMGRLIFNDILSHRERMARIRAITEMGVVDAAQCAEAVRALSDAVQNKENS